MNLAKGSTAALPYGAPAGVVIAETIDFQKHPLTATNKHQVINIPEGTHVAVVTARVIKGDTGAGTRTFDVGDAADPDGYIDGADAKTAGINVMNPTLNAGAIVGYSFGKTYTAASAIELTAVQDLTDCVVEVRALVFGA